MSRKNGFTLVELVVVVLILGILAAIAAPKIITNTGDAEDSGIAQTLSNVRDAIELYRAENGVYPPNAAANDIHTELDGYLRGANFPKVTVGSQNSRDVVNDVTEPVTSTGGAQGWVYNPNTGEIIVNSNATMNDGTTKYDEL
jgi:general secretion pathway protein G